MTRRTKLAMLDEWHVSAYVERGRHLTSAQIEVIHQAVTDRLAQAIATLDIDGCTLELSQ